MIKVEGVTKRYGPATAVDNISFEVERGEIVGFLGPNGAGKTTTMRILAGFLPPSEGTAWVADYDVMRDPLEVKKRIGYLPESPPVYPEMDVTGYLDFVARIKGLSSAEIPSRIDAAVERCSIGDVRHKLIGHLSKGYRQRVGLAQALIHSPEVLILDEPTAGLDPKQIIEVRELVRSLSGEHTIILSTHILSEVSGTCNRVIIINEGRIEASDTPENLTARLQGGASLEVEIDGPAEEIEARLAGVPGVTKVERGEQANGRSMWNVETERDATVRSRLAQSVVEAGWGLYGLRSIGLSLEDIFLKLTAAEKAASDEGSEDDGETQGATSQTAEPEAAGGSGDEEQGSES